MGNVNRSDAGNPADILNRYLSKLKEGTKTQDSTRVERQVIGDIDCDGKTDYAVKDSRDLISKGWQVRFSGTSIFGSPKKINDGKNVYAVGHKVSFKEGDKELEGTIEEFDVRTEPVKVGGLELDIQQPRITAQVRTPDGKVHYIDTQSDSFMRIVSPEELPVAKD